MEFTCIELSSYSCVAHTGIKHVVELNPIKFRITLDKKSSHEVTICTFFKTMFLELF